ncbi:MAG: heparinase II/III family protein, partial [Frankiaceae bacterium]|nr:heparinase II/III family protein [Frankiaceae bacterium]MBV9368825.1 heparinase II/III family protein [Frankiales bacterium]
WVELLTKWYVARPGKHDNYLVRAEQIASDFAAYNPPGGGPAGATAWTGMYAGQRATVYSCLNSLDSPYGVGTLTTMGGWLGNSAHDPGNWNQGIDFNIGLLAAGCVVGNATWADHARDRLISMATSTIDSQGAVGEQAPGYGPYVWARLGVAADKINECLGKSDTTVIQSQRAKLLDFLAWSTEPNSVISEIGDTFRTSPPAIGDAAGTSSEWAATGGASGTHPTALTALYSNAGYAFGRSSWDPFRDQGYYSLRFGPGWAFHGHQDHQQLTMSAYGEELIVDSGHDGYVADAYRSYLISPEAHSVMALPGVKFNKYAPTALTSSNTTNAAWQYYQFSDTAYAGLARTRNVLVSLDTPFAVVYDHASRSPRGLIETLWHLPAGMKVVRLTRSGATATTADGKVDLYIFQTSLSGAALPPGATGVVTGRTSPSYLGWVSHANGQRLKASVVTMGRSASAAGIVSIIVPAPHGTPAGVNAAHDSTGHTILTITVGSVQHVVTITSRGFIARRS